MRLRPRVLPLLVLGLALSRSGAAEPALDAALSLTDDGAYVVDARSKLAWPRCVEGMTWNGKTCTGEPRLMTHGEATAWAAQRAKADGVSWRLPRVTELRRWAARSGKLPPQTATLFPAAPVDWYWTLTAAVDTRAANPYDYNNIRDGRSSTTRLGVQQGWAVNMATGDAEGDVSKRSRLVVRLVSSQ